MFSRSFARELLDDRRQRDLGELRENLRDMARYDRWLGAFRLMLRLATQHLPSLTSLTGLDIGTGSADFIHYARRHAPLPIGWTGLDRSHDVLRVARAVSTSAPPTLLCARGERLPFADRSFDVVICAHVLHHLEPSQATTLLCECARVARQRIVMIDLARSYVTLAGAWLLTRVTSRNRMTWADGVQSARRAYTLDEIRVLARQAGLTNARVRQHGSTRLSLTWSKCETGKIAA